MKPILFTKDVLQALPKSELHVHLRGAMPLEVFTELAQKYSLDEVFRDAPPWRKRLCYKHQNIRDFIFALHRSKMNIADLLSFHDIQQFLATYSFIGCFIRDIADLRNVINGVIESLRQQNIVYAEITISIISYLKRGMALTEIKNCLDEAARFSDIRVQWIVDLVRDIGNGATLKLLHQVVDLECKSIVGITLGGSEHLFPPHLFSEVYSLARHHGLHLSIHAGEALGPESVWDALRLLGAERIGHGIRAIEDPQLVQYLAEQNIPLEVCPTSNLRTGIFPSYQTHPVKALCDAGVPITINTDDPVIFDTTLTDEYTHVSEMGVDEQNLFEILKNCLRYAFLPQEDIQRYLDNLEQAWINLVGVKHTAQS